MRCTETDSGKQCLLVAGAHETHCAIGEHGWLWFGPYVIVCTHCGKRDDMTNVVKAAQAKGRPADWRPRICNACLFDAVVNGLTEEAGADD